MYQFLYQLFGTVNHRIRNTCKFGNLNSITFICAAFYDLAQKYDIVTFFLDRNTVIVDTGIFLPVPSVHDNVWQTMFWLPKVLYY